MATGDIRALIENSGGSFDETTKLQATDSDVTTGTENSKVVTPKLLKDNKFPRVHVGTSAPSDTTMLWLDTN